MFVTFTSNIHNLSNNLISVTVGRENTVNITFMGETMTGRLVPRESWPVPVL
jgi:hypothetical protein